jgi:hypothetical protein
MCICGLYSVAILYKIYHFIAIRQVNIKPNDDGGKYNKLKSNLQWLVLWFATRERTICIQYVAENIQPSKHILPYIVHYLPWLLGFNKKHNSIKPFCTQLCCVYSRTLQILKEQQWRLSQEINQKTLSPHPTQIGRHNIEINQNTLSHPTQRWGHIKIRPIPMNDRSIFSTIPWGQQRQILITVTIFKEIPTRYPLLRIGTS